jgi:hypothetical protein
MTSMTTAPALSLPNPNDEQSILQHRDAVLAACSEIFSAIDRALVQAIPTAADVFALLNGSRDRAVHATLVRYIVRQTLSGNGVAAEEETPAAELEWVPNCGICVHVPGAEIRVLKSSDGQVPKSNSEARSRFYCSNQMWLFGEPRTLPTTNIKLVALWDIDQDYEYLGLEIACPKGELEDRTVDCYWKAPWSTSPSAAFGGQIAPAEDTDLEIQPIDPASQAAAAE